MRELDKKELLAKDELCTYFEGLCDALKMTKPELRKAIKIIREAPVRGGDNEYYNSDGEE